MNDQRDLGAGRLVVLSAPFPPCHHLTRNPIRGKALLTRTMHYSLETHPLKDCVAFTLRLGSESFVSEIRADSVPDGFGSEGGEPGALGLAGLAAQITASCELFYMKRIERIGREGSPVSCVRGCAACCRQLVTCSPPEAFLLLDRIDALPGGPRELVHGRFQEAERCLAEAGLLVSLTRINRPDLSPDDHFHLAEEYFRLGLECPLLEDELCRFYPVRPALCREYFVTSPASWCAAPFSKDVRPVPAPLPVRDALASLSADLLRTSIELVPLPLLLRWGKERDAARKKRWNARRLAEAFLAHLEYALQEAEAR